MIAEPPFGPSTWPFLDWSPSLRGGAACSGRCPPSAGQMTPIHPRSYSPSNEALPLHFLSIRGVFLGRKEGITCGRTVLIVLLAALARGSSYSPEDISHTPLDETKGARAVSTEEINLEES